MIVDFHTHVFSPRVKAERERYVVADSCFASLYSDKNARIATAEDLLGSMDRDEVDVSVILNLSWTTPDLCRESNDYILEAVARFPKRLIGFGAIPVQSHESALSEIERCAKAGMKGIGEIRPGPEFLDGKSTRARELAAAIRQNGLMLLVHASEPVGHLYPGKEDITPGRLYPFISSFPDLKLVCAHWGGGLPFYALMPEVKAALQNVYFDTAASPFLYNSGIFRSVSQIAGVDKILLGSDFPLLSQKRLIDEVRLAEITDPEKALILGGNAQRLLGRED